MSSAHLSGSVLGSRYVLGERIAVGGMGEVWRATDRVLERGVAIKLLRSDLIDSDDFGTRFQTEARLAAGLSHPGIAHVYDYVEDVHDDQRTAFLVMELVDGQPLSEQLARNDRPSLERIVSILHQTAEALGAAHVLGIVHRDIKPGNLLITPDGRVKITDFGIARAIDSVSITEVGQVIGTVRYMSPEQAQGKEATPASDVYALGVVGYEMLAGHTPFLGDNPAAIALAHVTATPRPLPVSVPVGLRSLIEQALTKLPEQRPPDGASFASAVHGIVIDPIQLESTAPTDTARRMIQPGQTGAIQATAVFEQAATTHIDEALHVGNAFAPDGPPPSDSPLLGDGWFRSRRRRRRVAAWGTAVAVVACLLVFAAFNRDSNDTSVAATRASTSTTAAAIPDAVATDLVTVDPAMYRGLTEAEARATLTAAGFDVATTTAASASELAGLVIDVRPSGPLARGSTVALALGDGTIVPVADPAADDEATSNKGNGKSKSKGKGRGND